MQSERLATKQELGAQAAAVGAQIIRAAIADRGASNIILATGASQFEVLGELVAASGIDWSVVTAFHLDEYLNMGDDHPASFRRYLRERFVEALPAGASLRAFHFVDGTAADAAAECARVGELLAAHPIDIAFIGIGENGHVAFNDPPADFDTEQAYLVVELDEACRRQQMGEGWFATLDDVPQRAISMSVRQIMKARTLIVSVPDQRKAEAVAGAVEGPVTNLCPASILQRHADARLFLDPASSSLLRQG